MKRRALIVIDVQNEYADGNLPITYPSGSLPRITAAMDAAERARIPVIVVQHTSLEEGDDSFVAGTRGWQLQPEVADRPRDVLIEKNLPGTFTGTELEPWLRDRDLDTLVVSGYMTQMCCDTTARQAAHLGFGVEFLADATGTLAFENEAGSIGAEELHRSVLVTQQYAFARVLTAGDWIAEVERAARG